MAGCCQDGADQPGLAPLLDIWGEAGRQGPPFPPTGTVEGGWAQDADQCPLNLLEPVGPVCGNSRALGL